MSDGPVTLDHRYHGVVDVTTLDGEHVGYLCAKCDASLPLWYFCDDCQWVDVTMFGDAQRSYVRGLPCSRHA